MQPFYKIVGVANSFPISLVVPMSFGTRRTDMTNVPTTDPVEMIPFGPVLLGQTEKTLQALLRDTLAGTGLAEPQWVALRRATMLDGQVDRAGLIAAVTDRAKFADASAIVDVLTERGLVVDGRPTAAGRDLIGTVLAASDRT